MNHHIQGRRLYCVGFLCKAMCKVSCMLLSWESVHNIGAFLHQAWSLLCEAKSMILKICVLQAKISWHMTWIPRQITFTWSMLGWFINNCNSYVVEILYNLCRTRVRLSRYALLPEYWLRVHRALTSPGLSPRVSFKYVQECMMYEAVNKHVDSSVVHSVVLTIHV